MFIMKRLKKEDNRSRQCSISYKRFTTSTAKTDKLKECKKKKRLGKKMVKEIKSWAVLLKSEKPSAERPGGQTKYSLT